MKPSDIAEVAHEVNRAYCAAMGDMSQVPWEFAPSWQRNSAIKGVVFHLENPDATPEQSHQEWLDLKMQEGWKHGPIKDPAKKEHPCFVPYQELPKEQKAKDYIFRQVVHSLSKFVERVEGENNAGMP